MNSTEEHPFAFFDWYLENQISKDLKEFYINITEELYFNNVDKVDRLNHVVKVLNIHHQDDFKSEYITFSFEGFIKRKLNQEINLTKSFIELGFQKRFSEKKEVKSYADFLRIKLDSFLNIKTYKEFYFLPAYFEQFSRLINQYSKQGINHSFVPSFILLDDSSNEKLKINTLYNLLIEIPSMISCSKNEFNNAFTGEEVEHGINWLVLGKNKLTSKVSLFYLIEQLIKDNHISKSILNDLNKYVRYVFRDVKGNELKNLKQSKSTYSINVTSKDRIDNIISSL